MRLLLSGLLLLSMPACRPAQPPAQSRAEAPVQRADGRAALLVLLQQQEAENSHGRSLCIVPALEASLGTARADFAVGVQPIPAHWFPISTATVTGPVAPSLSNRLDRLLTAAQRQPAVTGPPITADMVPTPARLGCRHGMDSHSFSTPVVMEDIAFIERGYGCGGECGGGMLFALQWQAGRWVPVAWMGTWIS